MSNYVTIEPTEFVNVRTGEKSYGVRIYDEYISAYDNIWESIPDDDLEVLERVLKDNNTGGAIYEALSFVSENQQVLYIGGMQYEWDQIKDLFEAYDV